MGGGQCMMIGYYDGGGQCMMIGYYDGGDNV